MILADNGNILYCGYFGTKTLIMIIGIFLRNFKTYSGINYIPLTNGHSFCGLVGNNGIGKSSVLESLDSLLNGKTWNYNVVVKKSGLNTVKPYIVPVYLLSFNQITEKNTEKFKQISDYVWNVEENDISLANRVHFKSFQEQRNWIKISNIDKLLIPLGLSYDGVPSLSIFNTKKLVEVLSQDEEKTQLQDEDLNHMLPLNQELKELFEYIYIPKDIDPENFTQLETKEIQSLMGETLNEIVEKCVPQSKIQDINFNLNSFIDSLSNILGEYSFRTTGERQVNLRKFAAKFSRNCGLVCKIISPRIAASTALLILKMGLREIV
ncbi:AAA family ATPase [Nostoc sp. UHCC 0702]|nr:AAA family ATPase [Nostoc sp. UHCC 0702]